MLRVYCDGCGRELLVEHHAAPASGGFVTKQAADYALVRARWRDGRCPDCQHHDE